MATSSWLEPGRGTRSRYRRPRLPSLRAPLLVVVLLAAIGGVAYLVAAHDRTVSHQRAAARRFVRAWDSRDPAALWRALDPASRRAYPQARLATLVHRADTAATVTSASTAAPSSPKDGKVRLAVAVGTRLFGTLRGRFVLPVAGGGVRWTPALRLPGLRPGEAPRRTTLEAAHRAEVLDRDGHPLIDTAILAPFVAGLKARYAARLDGLPGAELRFGTRRIARVAAHAGHAVRSTLRPRLQAAAASALGSRLGGVAVLAPSDGSVLALAGIAVSAPQPPGSTFKIVTLAGALAAGIATPASRYPARSSATLAGVKLSNAGGESCGGSLSASFADSCNSVFAPLGARLGATRLVARAEAFGFNSRPRVPNAKPSTISAAEDLRDALAVGSAAIGQEKDLATPLQMASVGATIGTLGRRAEPRVVASDPVRRRRVVSVRVAGEVRDMMIDVVRSGTGQAGALPGVQVAGKTGTAELRFTGNASNDPKNTDAWFVAFAPAAHPTVAVAVMLVGAGYGGTSAAPIARRVLAAALR